MNSFAGIINLRFPDINRNNLSSMGETLQHLNKSDIVTHTSDYIGLVQTAPQTDHDKLITCQNDRFVMVLSGKIYNFPELKSALQKQGYVFRSSLDAEVLLELFALHGKKFLQELNGQFTLAVWDKNKNTLFAARDRMGQKPFYFAKLNNHFLFASEIKAILEFPEFKKEIDKTAAQYFFTYQYVPDPFCIFKGIQKLPAGHQLVFTQENQKPVLERYWNVSFTPKMEIEESEASQKLLHHLDNAISHIQTKQAGVLLSGNLNSSALVPLLAKHNEGKNISTFFLSFDNNESDAYLYAQTVAEKFNTDHHFEIVDSKILQDQLPELAKHFDEPFGNVNAIHSHLLYNFVKKSTHTVLNDDGCNEIFGGHASFFKTRYAKLYDKLPEFIQQSAKTLSKLIPSPKVFDDSLNELHDTKDEHPVIKNQIWLSEISNPVRENLFRKEYLQEARIDTLKFLKEEMNHCDSSETLDQLLYFYQKFYLDGCVLTQTNNLSLAHTLNTHSPYLDIHIIDFVNSLPQGFKLKGITTKYLLKKAFNRSLPAMITHQPVKTETLPLKTWFRTHLKELLLSTLTKERIEKDGVFSWATVSQCLEEHFQNERNHTQFLFSLLMFHFWMNEYL